MCDCRLEDLYERELLEFEDFNRQNRTGLSPYVVQKSVDKATAALMGDSLTPTGEESPTLARTGSLAPARRWATASVMVSTPPLPLLPTGMQPTARTSADSEPRPRPSRRMGSGTHDGHGDGIVDRDSVGAAGSARRHTQAHAHKRKPVPQRLVATPHSEEGRVVWVGDWRVVEMEAPPSPQTATPAPHPAVV